MAAFIVIAIVAAVLLVTTVRSQAAPRWLDPDKLPATVVAAPSVEPHLWDSVADGVNQVVQGGAVLVRRTTTVPSVADRGGTSLTVAPSTAVAADSGTRDAGPPATRQHDTDATTHQVTRDPQSRVAAPHRYDSAPTQDEPLPETGAPWALQSAPGTHDHGRHLGWYLGLGHGKPIQTEARHRGHSNLG